MKTKGRLFTILPLVTFVFLNFNYTSQTDKKFKTPLNVDIVVRQNDFLTAEPVEGLIAVRNASPSVSRATFIVHLYKDGKLQSETFTEIKSLKIGTTEFTFEEFGIPSFNRDEDASGTWRLSIKQLNVDESYRREETITISNRELSQ